MIIVGIDPGLSGAVAELNTTMKEVKVRDMPTVKGKTRGRDLDTLQLVEECQYHWDIDLIIMEKPVLARPGEGRGSIGKFGYTTGLTEGIYRAMYPVVPFVLVSPQKWKAQMVGLGSSKDEARELAMKLYPPYKDLFKRKKDDGRAEALLIAQYGWAWHTKKESDVE